MSTNQQNLIGIDNLGVEHIPKEIIKFIEQKSIINKFLQNTTIRFDNVWIGFVDFMLIGKSLLDYSNLLSPNDYEKNDKKTRKYFQQLKSFDEKIMLCYL